MNYPPPPRYHQTCQFDRCISENAEKPQSYGEPLQQELEPVVAYIGRTNYTGSATERNLTNREFDYSWLRSVLVPIISSHRDTFGYEERNDCHMFTFCYDSHQPVSRFSELWIFAEYIVNRSYEHGRRLVLVLASWDALTSHKESFVNLFEPYAYPQYEKFSIELHVYSCDLRQFFTVDAIKVCKVLSDRFPDTYDEAPDNVQIFIDCLRAWFMRELMRHFPNIEDVSSLSILMY